MNHTIEMAHVADYEFSHQIARSIGLDANKELTAVVKGLDVHYEVLDDSTLVCSTKSLAEAVSAYNGV
jgi:hypothetical protein